MPAQTNGVTKAIVVLEDGTKVLQTYRTIVGPNGVKQIQAGQPITQDQVQAQIDSLTADLALFTA